MEELGGGRQQLVLVVSPFQGHMTPMLQLGAVLHSKGFSITIAHAKLNSPNPSTHPEFIFLPISDGLSAIYDSGTFTQFLEDLNNNCRAEFHNCLTQVIKEQKGIDNRVCIIHDNLMYFAEAVASDLNLPSIVMRSCSASYVLPSLAIPRLQGEGRFPVKGSMLHELVPEFPPLRYKDLPYLNTPPQDISKFITIANSVKRPSAVIWNTVAFLEPLSLSQLRHQYGAPIFPVGPLHEIAPSASTSFLKEDTSCIAWLNKQAPRSAVYVSLGSLMTLNKEKLAEIAWGLANSDQPFLWVIRPGSIPGSDWIEFLPEDFLEETRTRSHIVKWAPQKEVLSHIAVGAFWSHCGWNSTLESISKGIPMICQPFMGDQIVNARNITYEWRIGLDLEFEKLTREVTERAIRRLLVDNEREEVRNRAIEIQEKVKAALLKGGSSHKSLNDLVDFIKTHS